MGDYATAAARMDARVDNRLGDSISYSRDGVQFIDIQGFVIVPDVAGAANLGLDPMGMRVRIKIAKTVVDKISNTHRLRAERAGPGLFRPRVDRPTTAGRYHIFDIENV